MAALEASVPSHAPFSQEVAQTTLAKYLNDDALAALLWTFCSNNLEESEHQLLLDNRNLVSQETVEALRQVALRANHIGDVTAAYFYHRKAELLNACLEFGISEFYESLHDPERALAFFDRVGPPPGYEDDYWNRLIDAYKEGDHVNHHVLRQEYEHVNWLEMNGNDLQPLENDMSITKDIMALLRRKYKVVRGESTETLLNLEEVLATGMESQARERCLLVQEFIQSGMPLLLNWMLSLTPASRFGVLELCLSDVVLASALDIVLSPRQRRHLLPELADLPLLVSDGIDRLQRLLVRIAAEQENNFALNVAASEIEEARVVFVNRLEQTSNDDKPALLKEVDQWAREKSREYWYNVPAVIRIEHLVETSLIAHHADVQPLGLSPTTDLDQFSLPFHLYRTRGLQLFALSLIERCLKTCLPPRQKSPAPASQPKKKKKQYI